MAIITLAELNALTINADLQAAIVATPALIQSYIDYVSSKVLLYIKCTDIFLNDDWVTYTYPDDLKEATAFLVESLYLLKSDWALNEANTDMLMWVKSKKVDDFSVSYGAWVQQAFFGIPALPEYIDILDSYKCENASFGYFDLLSNKF